MDCEGTYFSEEKNPMIRLTVEVISCILRLTWLEASSFSFHIPGQVLSITQSFLAVISSKQSLK